MLIHKAVAELRSRPLFPPSCNPPPRPRFPAGEAVIGFAGAVRHCAVRRAAGFLGAPVAGKGGPQEGVHGGADGAGHSCERVRKVQRGKHCPQCAVLRSVMPRFSLRQAGASRDEGIQKTRACCQAFGSDSLLTCMPTSMLFVLACFSGMPSRRDRPYPSTKPPGERGTTIC